MSSIVRPIVALLFAFACSHGHGGRLAVVGIDNDLEVIDVDTHETVHSIPLGASARSVLVSANEGCVHGR